MKIKVEVNKNEGREKVQQTKYIKVTNLKDKISIIITNW